MPERSSHATLARKLSIFITHPSDFMTDERAHGDGLAAFEFVRRLAARGHALHVAVPAMSLRAGAPGGVQLYPIRCQERVAALRPFEYMLKVAQLFRQVRRRHRIDLLHQLNPVNPALSSLLAYCGVPLVLGLFVSDWPASAPVDTPRASRLGVLARAVTREPLRALDVLQQRRAAALLISTPAASRRLDPQAAASGRVHLLPYGVDTHRFSPGPQPRSGPPEILFLGSLNWRKGVGTLLAAFAAVVERIPECRLRIAGTGPAEGALRDRLASVPWRSAVELVGGVERSRVPELLRACSVVCMPSFGEPFGLVALEAMATGKPVIGTAAGGLDYVISERGGRRVPPGDAAALAGALIEVLSSASLCLEMGERNRALAESTYAWESVITRLEAIYYDILACPERAASAGTAPGGGGSNAA
jgi:glycosyltransferase involved in cell wall biosynthesis